MIEFVVSMEIWNCMCSVLTSTSLKTHYLAKNRTKPIKCKNNFLRNYKLTFVSFSKL